MNEFWIGFSDEICKVANKPYRDMRIRHMNGPGRYVTHDFTHAVVHTVGRWWLCEGAIIVRNFFAISPATIIHHLAPFKACSSFPSVSQRWSYADARQRIAYLADLRQKQALDEQDSAAPLSCPESLAQTDC